MGSDYANTPLWDTHWPTTPGWYWFYGRPYGRLNKFEAESAPELIPVRVRLAGGARNADTFPVYIANGAFLYKNEAGNGYWLPMEVPQTLPAVPREP